MLGTAFDKVVGYLDKRLVLTVLLPLLAFSVAGGSVVLIHVGWAEALAWWEAVTSEQRLVLAVVGAAGFIFVGLLLSSQIGLLTRWYEGYWGEGAIGGWLAGVGRRMQRRRHERLDPGSDRDFEVRYRLFPRDAADLLPTRLGNVFKGAETYPSDVGRYGMDAVFFWPRLHAVMPQHFRDTLAEARSSLDLLIVTSFLALAFAALSAAYLATVDEVRWWLWSLAIGAGVVTSRVAYLGALRTAVVFGELVRCAFDLYRDELRKHLGFAAPASLEDERALWHAVGQQLYRRMASDQSRLVYPASPRSVDAREPD
ncbi:MAG: hypothetical protein ACLGI2_01080 [Acidimicrobiia bacterium]